MADSASDMNHRVHLQEGRGGKAITLVMWKLMRYVINSGRTKDGVQRLEGNPQN